MKMKDGGSMSKHLNDFTVVTNQLGFIDKGFNVEVRVLLLLSSLQDNWKYVVTAVI